MGNLIFSTKIAPKRSKGTCQHACSIRLVLNYQNVLGWLSTCTHNRVWTYKPFWNTFLPNLFKQLVSRSHPLPGGVTSYLQDHDCLRSAQEFFSMWKPYILNTFDLICIYYNIAPSWVFGLCICSEVHSSALQDCVLRFFRYVINLICYEIKSCLEYLIFT